MKATRRAYCICGDTLTVSAAPGHYADAVVALFWSEHHWPDHRPTDAATASVARRVAKRLR